MIRPSSDFGTLRGLRWVTKLMSQRAVGDLIAARTRGPAADGEALESRAVIREFSADTQGPSYLGRNQDDPVGIASPSATV
jgi:hypothetical protein